MRRRGARRRARAATRPRSGPRSWALRPFASRRSRSSAAPACASAASRRRPGCRPRSSSRRPRRASPSSASRWTSPSSISRRRTSGRTRVVHQMTQGVATLFKANGVEWVKGTGRFKDANTIAVEGGEDVTFKSAIIATGSFPLRPPIEGLDSALCVDSTGLLAQTEVPRRLVVLGGGIIGCEFASIFHRFGSEVTIIEMLQSLIPQEDEDAAKELAKQFGRRGHHAPAREAVHEGRGVRRRAHRPFRRGRDRRGRPDARLGRPGPARRRARPRGHRRRVRPAGKGIAADEHRRTTVPHIYAVGDCAGYWQLAHTAFREGEVAAENALGPRRRGRQPRRSAPDLHRSGDRRRRPDRDGGARAVRRRRRRRQVPVGCERARRHAGRDGRAGSSRSTRPATASSSGSSWSART